MDVDMYSKQICFVQRKSDGKFLRGSKVFPWVKTWRKAAVLSPDLVRQFNELGVLKLRYGIDSLSEIKLVLRPECLS